MEEHFCKNQIINFDKKDSNLIDTTFIRVNKSIEWFTNIKQIRG